MRQEEALKAMDLFEGAQEHNRVSKRSLKNWVVNISDATPHPIHRSAEKKNREEHLRGACSRFPTAAVWIP
jgi:hypothetical protein